MEDYLMKYGFTGNEFGLDSYFNKENTTASKTVEPQTRNKFDNVKLEDLPLTIAFVAMQGSAKERYTTDKALMAGTLFPQLDKPFLGKKII
ncbi:MAG: spore coat associated protein CotJA [Clostridia bacterium]|nr:spore coat associated protein CotJA [Clostridia bacterium]